MINPLRDINDKRLFVLSFVLSIPMFTHIIALFHGLGSVLTAGMYGLSYLIFLKEFLLKIKIHNVIPMVVFALVCMVNIVIFPDSLEYFKSFAFLLSTFYYFVLSSIIFFDITDWSQFVRIFRPFAVISIVFAPFVVNRIIGLRDDDAGSYMDFSYAILPMVINMYLSSRIYRRKFDLILAIFGLFIMFIYGSRMALFSVLLFIICYEIFILKISTLKVVLIGASCLLLYMGVGFISSTEELSENSHVLGLLEQETLFESEERMILYEKALDRIETMGTEVSGIFGDRPYCYNVYPHNIILEIIMSYGIIIGPIVIILILYLFIYGMRKQNSGVVVLFFFCAIFCRFLVSGSYIIEGRFWVCIFSLMSIVKNNSSIKYSR